MSSVLVRILTAKPIGGTSLRLTLTDGRVVERDVGPLLRGPVFAALFDDPQVFWQVRVEGGTLVWPGELDLCPDTVIWGGIPPAEGSGQAEPPTDFETGLHGSGP